MKILKSNSKRSYKYLLIVPTLLSIFSFFSFKAYNVPTDYSFIELVTHDTLPFEENDTIITLDASTGIETMSVVKRTNYDPAEIEKILKQYPNIISYSDTSIIFNPETYEERVIIATRQIVEGYKVLIDRELKKSNPNYDLIKKWQKEGEIK